MTTPSVVNNNQSHRVDLDVQVASLTTKVANLDDGQKNIIATLGALGQKLDSRGSTNWGVIASFIGVMVTAMGVLLSVITVVGSLVYGQISREQERTTSNLMKLDDKFMPADAIKENLEIRGKRNEERSHEAEKRDEVLGKRIDDVSTDLAKVRENVVKREEHVQIWKADDAAFAEKQRQIDDLRTRLNDLYSAKDIIRDLNDRTKMLEAQIRK